jgi:glucose-6-phosphate dehydrogenase assembly protein OpcA
MAQPLTARWAATAVILVIAASEVDAALARHAIVALDGFHPVHGVVVTPDRDRPVPELRSFIDGVARGDLRRVLWQPTGLPPVDEPMLDWADHVIVDSRSVAGVDGPGGLDGLAGLVERSGLRPVTDLAWVDLAPWRDLVARLFVGRDFAPFLGGVRHVRVEGDAGPRTLLAGWLLSRLRLSPEAVEARNGDQVSVEIAAEHAGRRARFSVAWSADAELLDARAVVSGGPGHLRRWRAEERTTAWLLREALTHPSADAVYGEALAAAVALRPSGRR